jgi:hypothetical protein
MKLRSEKDTSSIHDPTIINEKVDKIHIIPRFPIFIINTYISEINVIFLENQQQDSHELKDIIY